MSVLMLGEQNGVRDSSEACRDKAHSIIVCRCCSLLAEVAFFVFSSYDLPTIFWTPSSLGSYDPLPEGCSLYISASKKKKKC